MQVAKIAQSAKAQGDAPRDLAIVSLDTRPMPTMSIEAMGVLQCLDGYLRTLMAENAQTSGAVRLDAEALKRKHAFLEPDMEGRKLALRPSMPATSALMAQLGGKQAVPCVSQPPSVPQPPSMWDDEAYWISPERQAVIDSALMSTLNDSPLIKPIFWPHFETIVDAQLLREAYPEHANKPVGEIAHALGGMVDYELQGFAELWRQRKHLNPADFYRLVQPYMQCPITLEGFEHPILTLEGRNVSLRELAEYYKPGPRRLFGGSPALGQSVYGYPNRRLAEICRAMRTPNAEYVAPDVSSGLGIWEVGTLYWYFREQLFLGGYDLQSRKDLREHILAKAPREAQPELTEGLETFAQINSVGSMLLDDGQRNMRGELLLRASKANELLFNQLVAIVQEMEDGKGINDARVRIAADAALINAPIHSNQEHFVRNQAPVLIAALRQSDDLGSIVRSIFFEQTSLGLKRDEAQPLLREVDVGWLRAHDPMGLTYLQMAWHPILYPRPACHTRWEPTSTRNKLDSLTYALWVGNRDLNFSTLFEPFEDVTDVAASISLEPWEGGKFHTILPWHARFALGRSRSPSMSSSFSSLRHQLEDAGFSAHLGDSRHSSNERALVRRRSTHSLRSLHSIRQVT